jgi:hypothetical protein
MPNQNHASLARPDAAFGNLPSFYRSRATIGPALVTIEQPRHRPLALAPAQASCPVSVGFILARRAPGLTGPATAPERGRRERRLRRRSSSA